MSKLTGLVHSFAHAFSSVDKLAQHRDGLAVLRKLISSPALSQLRDSIVGDAAVPDVNVDGLFDEFGDLKVRQTLLGTGGKPAPRLTLAQGFSEWGWPFDARGFATRFR